MYGCMAVSCLDPLEKGGGGGQGAEGLEWPPRASGGTKSGVGRARR